MIYYKGKEHKKGVLKGTQHVYNYVSPTMGAKGKHMLLDPTGLTAFAVNDGATIAQFLTKLANPLESRVAALVTQAAMEAAKRSGDGTTLTTVLIYEIYKAALKASKKDSTVNIAKTLETIKEGIKKYLKSDELIKSNETNIMQVAMTSTKDEKMAKAIADVKNKAGKSGFVTIKRFIGPEGYKTYSKDGYIIPTGIQHTNFVNKPNGIIAYDNVELILINGNLKRADEAINKIGQHVMRNKDKVFALVSNGVSEKTLEVFLQNNLQNNVFPIVIVGKTPAEMSEKINDIILLNGGGKSYTTDELIKLQTPIETIKVKGIEQSKSLTAITFNDSKGKNVKLEETIKELEKVVKDSKTPEAAKTFTKMRLASLTTGFHTLEIYGESEFIVKDKYERADDGLRAMKSAEEFGVLIGGGNPLLRAGQRLIDKNESKLHKLVGKALQAPFYKINENAEIKVSKSDIDTLLNGRKIQTWDNYPVPKRNKNTWGVDLDKNILIDLEEKGIYDSFETVNVALDLAFHYVIILIRTYGSAIDESAGK